MFIPSRSGWNPLLLLGFIYRKLPKPVLLAPKLQCFPPVAKKGGFNGIPDSNPPRADAGRQRSRLFPHHSDTMRYSRCRQNLSTIRDISAPYPRQGVQPRDAGQGYSPRFGSHSRPDSPHRRFLRQGSGITAAHHARRMLTKSGVALRWLNVLACL